MSTDVLNLVIALTLLAALLLAFARMVHGVWWSVAGTFAALATVVVLAVIVGRHAMGVL